MTMEVDPQAAASWRMIADRLAVEPSERRRQLLATVAEHVEAEVCGDVDRLMETMVADPQYHFYGQAGSPGPRGRDSVIAHYEGLVATGMNRLEFAVSRVVVDDEHVVTEGVFRHAVAGAMLAAAGLLPAVSDDRGWHVVEYRAIVVWPADAAGRLVGEDIYFDGEMTVVRELTDGELRHLGPLERAARSGE